MKFDVMTLFPAMVEGVLSEEYSKLYRAKGPVLTVKCAKRAEKPEQEVATFY